VSEAIAREAERQAALGGNEERRRLLALRLRRDPGTCPKCQASPSQPMENSDARSCRPGDLEHCCCVPCHFKAVPVPGLISSLVPFCDDCPRSMS